MRRTQLRAALCIAVLTWVSSVIAAEETNEILVGLLENGVTLSDGTKASLPPPVMDDGLNAAAQEKVMAGLVQPARLQSFRGGNLNDWHELKISGTPANVTGTTASRHIDLYYIANGTLETFLDKNFIKQNMNGGGFHFLTAPELAARNITLSADTESRRARIAHGKMDLFNMVKVRGTGHGITTSSKDGQVTAFILDDRFKEDKEFPNEDRGIILNRVGKKVLSDPALYQGAGGYMKVTPLVGGSRPQVFIEHHIVFEEPFEWFNGQNTLTSKLPEKVRADVRSFRRDLQKFAQANPAGKAAANPLAPEKK